MKKSSLKFLVVFCSLTFCLSGCDFFKSEKSIRLDSLNEQLTKLNKTYKGKEIVLSSKLSDSIFKDKTKKSNTILVYYNADCSVCYKELQQWKNLISYFKEIDKNLNIKFILFTLTKAQTEAGLKKTGFSKSLIVYDKKNDFLKQYEHVEDKEFNTMLLDKDNKIVTIGSPLKSDNLKRIYTELITK